MMADGPLRGAVASAVELTCKRCGDTQRKELDDDEMIGPHERVKDGMGLAQREPDDIVTRRVGYGTMPAASCETCGCLKHEIQVVAPTDDGKSEVPCGCGEFTITVSDAECICVLDVVCPECDNHFGWDTESKRTQNGGSV